MSNDGSAAFAASGPEGADFSLRMLTYSEDPIGALIFVAKSDNEAQAFLRQLINVMFPSGGRSSSVLDIKTTDGGSLFFEVSSHEGRVTLLMKQVPPEIGSVVRRTLRERGSLPIIFGFEADGQVILVDPTQNNLVRTSAYVDGEMLDGTRQGAPSNWSDFFATVANEHHVVPLEAT